VEELINELKKYDGDLPIIVLADPIYTQITKVYCNDDVQYGAKEPIKAVIIDLVM
jgi:hypothetical protein